MTTNNLAWGSRVGLILAMAGNAVGLGNFLRFPDAGSTKWRRRFYYSLPGMFPFNGNSSFIC